MARRPEGWTLYQDKRPGRDGTHYVRFRHQGHRVYRSTGETDRRAAKVAAARIYEEVVTGRHRGPGSPGTRVASIDLADAFGGWLEVMEVEHPETAAQYEMYAATHFLPFFRRLDRIDTRNAERYATARLRRVKRTTVLKELSALRGFLRWCHRHELIRVVPEIRSPSRRALGTPCASQNRKSGPVVLTPDEAKAVLACLPEHSRRGCRPRAFYTLMWETALRRSTLWKLRVPEHYHRGSRSLNVTREIDKSRFARVIPLSPRAVATLEDVAPELGLVFGKRDLRHALRSAARKAGLPASKWKHLSNHDFRHSAITYWASRTTNLAGVQYLAGHRHAATTGRYVNAGYSHARAVLEALGE